MELNLDQLCWRPEAFELVS